MQDVCEPERPEQATEVARAFVQRTEGPFLEGRGVGSRWGLLKHGTLVEADPAPV